jgi:serine/threonine-protein phosphatase 2A activator
MIPSKQIKNHKDLELFLQSDTFSNFFAFIDQLSEAAIGGSFSDEPKLFSITRIFRELALLVDETPAMETKSRFGNAAFRIWHSKMVARLEQLHSGLVPEKEIVECSGYLMNCFGNAERIDYGTGHEANFVAWLYCLHQIGAFEKEDFSFVALNVVKE